VGRLGRRLFSVFTTNCLLQLHRALCLHTDPPGPAQKNGAGKRERCSNCQRGYRHFVPRVRLNLLPGIFANASDDETRQRFRSSKHLPRRMQKLHDTNVCSIRSVCMIQILALCSAFGIPAVSKYAMNLWTTELQRRLDADGCNILVMVLHPGAVNTFAHYFPLSRLFKFLFSSFMTTPDDGASTSLFAAASPLVRADPDKYRGQYMLPVGTLTSSKASRDGEMARKLWSNTESFLQSLDI
jgi:NAD(P)-dependent dehydrogenase (short-subunit alcohol dehydrogenase family)